MPTRTLTYRIEMDTESARQTARQIEQLLKNEMSNIKMDSMFDMGNLRQQVAEIQRTMQAATAGGSGRSPFAAWEADANRALASIRSIHNEVRQLNGQQITLGIDQSVNDAEHLRQVLTNVSQVDLSRPFTVAESGIATFQQGERQMTAVMQAESQTRRQIAGSEQQVLASGVDNAERVNAERRITQIAIAESNERIAQNTEETNRLLANMRRVKDDHKRNEEEKTSASRKTWSEISGFANSVQAGIGTAMQVGQFAAELADLATSAARSREAFVMLSGGVEESEAKLWAVEKASGGSIDRLQAMGLANKAAALGIAENAKQLERATRFAKMASGVLGIEVPYALDNLAAAASNLSYVRLDQMGISSTQVRNRVRELTAEFKDMTKEQAFLQATLEIGEKNFGALEGTIITAASGMEKLRASWENFKVAFADGDLGQTMDKVAAGMAGALDNLAPMQMIAVDDEALTVLDDLLVQMKDKVDNAGIFSNISDFIWNMPEADEVIGDLELLRSSIVDVGESINSGVPGLDTYRAGLLELVTAHEMGYHSVISTAGSFDEITQKIELTAGVYERASAIMGQGSIQASEQARALYDQLLALEQGLASGETSQAQYDDGVKAITRSMRELTETINLAPQEPFQYEGMVTGMTASMEGLVGSVTEATGASGDAFADLTQALIAGEMSFASYQSRWQMLTGVVSETDGTLKEAQLAIHELNEAFANGDITKVQYGTGMAQISADILEAKSQMEEAIQSLDSQPMEMSGFAQGVATSMSALVDIVKATAKEGKEVFSGLTESLANGDMPTDQYQQSWQMLSGSINEAGEVVKQAEADIIALNEALANRDITQGQHGAQMDVLVSGLQKAKSEVDNVIKSFEEVEVVNLDDIVEGVSSSMSSVVTSVEDAVADSQQAFDELASSFSNGDMSFESYEKQWEGLANATTKAHQTTQQVEAEIAALNAAFDRGGMSQGDYSMQMAALASQMRSAKSDIDSVTNSILRQAQSVRQLKAEREQRGRLVSSIANTTANNQMQAAAEAQKRAQDMANRQRQAAQKAQRDAQAVARRQQQAVQQAQRQAQQVSRQQKQAADQAQRQADQIAQKQKQTADQAQRDAENVARAQSQAADKAMQDADNLARKQQQMADKAQRNAESAARKQQQSAEKAQRDAESAARKEQQKIEKAQQQAEDLARKQSQAADKAMQDADAMAQKQRQLADQAQQKAEAAQQKQKQSAEKAQRDADQMARKQKQAADKAQRDAEQVANKQRSANEKAQRDAENAARKQQQMAEKAHREATQNAQRQRQAAEAAQKNAQQAAQAQQQSMQKVQQQAESNANKQQQMAEQAQQAAQRQAEEAAQRQKQVAADAQRNAQAASSRQQQAAADAQRQAEENARNQRAAADAAQRQASERVSKQQQMAETAHRQTMQMAQEQAKFSPKSQSQVSRPAVDIPSSQIEMRPQIEVKQLDLDLPEVKLKPVTVAPVALDVTEIKRVQSDFVNAGAGVSDVMAHEVAERERANRDLVDVQQSQGDVWDEIGQVQKDGAEAVYESQVESARRLGQVEYGVETSTIQLDGEVADSPQDWMRAQHLSMVGDVSTQMLAMIESTEISWTDAVSEVEQAFEGAAREMEGMLQQVEGLFEASQVTAEDMDDSKAGFYQEKADEYLRRLRDEVYNGIDWDDVSITDAAARLGIDASLPAEEIFKQFETAWNDSSLFSNSANLDLINQGAVKLALEAEQARKDGQANILKLFSVGDAALDDFAQAAQDAAARAEPPDVGNVVDAYLHKLKNEIENGYDYEGVSVEDAAARLGIDPTLPAEVILEKFEAAWNDRSLFADGLNLDLFNRAAVEASIVAQKEVESGTDAVNDFFNTITDDFLGIDSGAVERALAEMEGPRIDDWLVKLQEMVLEGATHEGVSVEDAAKRLNIDPTLPAEVILQKFEAAWKDNSLFANGMNLDLVNEAAIEASIAAQKEVDDGTEHINALFERVSNNFLGIDSSAVERALAEMEGPRIDDWLVKLQETVLEGATHEGVSVEDAAKRLNIDPTLPAEVILQKFEAAWNDKSLFADGLNLDLFNRAAIEASTVAQQEVEAGAEAVNDFFQQVTDDFLGIDSSVVERALAEMEGLRIDDWLVKLQETVLEGATHEGVSVEDAAKRLNIDPTLPAEAILARFEQAWKSGELFAGGANLDLYDEDAILASFEAQKKLEDGKKHVDAMFEELQNMALGISGNQDAVDAALAQFAPPDMNEWLTKLKEEVLDGVEHDSVSIEEAAKRLNIDASLPTKVILAEFEKAWESGALFAGGANLDLINTDAITAAAEAQKIAEDGQEHLAKLFDEIHELTIGVVDGIDQLDRDAAYAEAKMMADIDMPRMDEWLVKLKDEVLNGVDHEGVSIEDAAARMGIDPTLPVEVILAKFEKAWNDNSLFADLANLELINEDAIRAMEQAEQAQETGAENVASLFAKSVDVAGEITSVAGEAAYVIQGEMERMDQYLVQLREEVLHGVQYDNVSIEDAAARLSAIGVDTAGLDDSAIFAKFEEAWESSTLFSVRDNLELISKDAITAIEETNRLQEEGEQNIASLFMTSVDVATGLGESISGGFVGLEGVTDGFEDVAYQVQGEMERMDQYLVRLREEVMHGIQYDDVSIEDAASRLEGIGVDTSGLDSEAILEKFEEAWNNESLFAVQKNLELVNQQAITSILETNRLQEEGGKNLASLFMTSVDVADEIGVSVEPVALSAGFAADGMEEAAYVAQGEMERMDQYLVRLREEVMRGIQYADVSIEDAAARLNAIGVNTEGLNNQEIFSKFEQAWEDSTLFSVKSNLELINQQAIVAIGEANRLQEEGEKNIASLFLTSVDVATDIGTSAAGSIDGLDNVVGTLAGAADGVDTVAYQVQGEMERMDQYLVRLREEVMHGIQYDDVSIEDAASRLEGIGVDTSGLDSEAILEKFEEAWNNESLFAVQKNLELVNQQAITAILETNRLQEEGSKNLSSLFMTSVDVADEIGVSVEPVALSAGYAADGMDEAAYVVQGEMERMDQYLVRLREEVMKGIEYADVSIEDAAARLNSIGVNTEGLNNQEIFSKFEQAWEDESLFSVSKNLELINQQAISSIMEANRLQQEGSDNVASLFMTSVDVADTVAAGSTDMALYSGLAADGVEDATYVVQGEMERIDQYLVRLREEVMKGIEYDDVSIGDAAKRLEAVGIDTNGMDAEQIFNRFEQAWKDQSLFAFGENLEIINQAAVQAAANTADLVESGQKAYQEFFESAGESANTLSESYTAATEAFSSQTAEKVEMANVDIKAAADISVVPEFTNDFETKYQGSLGEYVTKFDGDVLHGVGEVLSANMTMGFLGADRSTMGRLVTLEMAQYILDNGVNLESSGEQVAYHFAEGFIKSDVSQHGSTLLDDLNSSLNDDQALAFFTDAGGAVYATFVDGLERGDPGAVAESIRDGVTVKLLEADLSPVGEGLVTQVKGGMLRVDLGETSVNISEQAVAALGRDDVLVAYRGAGERLTGNVVAGMGQVEVGDAGSEVVNGLLANLTLTNMKPFMAVGMGFANSFGKGFTQRDLSSYSAETVNSFSEGLQSEQALALFRDSGGAVYATFVDELAAGDPSSAVKAIQDQVTVKLLEADLSPAGEGLVTQVQGGMLRVDLGGTMVNISESMLGMLDGDDMVLAYEDAGGNLVGHVVNGFESVNVTDSGSEVVNGFFMGLALADTAALEAMGVSYSGEVGKGFTKTDLSGYGDEVITSLSESLGNEQALALFTDAGGAVYATFADGLESGDPASVAQAIQNGVVVKLLEGDLSPAGAGMMAQVTGGMLQADLGGTALNISMSAVESLGKNEVLVAYEDAGGTLSGGLVKGFENADLTGSSKEIVNGLLTGLVLADMTPLSAMGMSFSGEVGKGFTRTDLSVYGTELVESMSTSLTEGQALALFTNAAGEVFATFADGFEAGDPSSAVKAIQDKVTVKLLEADLSPAGEGLVTQVQGGMYRVDLGGTMVSISEDAIAALGSDDVLVAYEGAGGTLSGSIVSGFEGADLAGAGDTLIGGLFMSLTQANTVPLAAMGMSFSSEVGKGFAQTDAGGFSQEFVDNLSSSLEEGQALAVFTDAGGQAYAYFTDGLADGDPSSVMAAVNSGIVIKLLDGQYVEAGQGVSAQIKGGILQDGLGDVASALSDDVIKDLGTGEVLVAFKDAGGTMAGGVVEGFEGVDFSKEGEKIPAQLIAGLVTADTSSLVGLGANLSGSVQIGTQTVDMSQSGKGLVTGYLLGLQDAEEIKKLGAVGVTWAGQVVTGANAADLSQFAQAIANGVIPSFYQPGYLAQWSQIGTDLADVIEGDFIIDVPTQDVDMNETVEVTGVKDMQDGLEVIGGSVAGSMTVGMVDEVIALPDLGAPYVGRVLGDMAKKEHHADLEGAGSNVAVSVSDGTQAEFTLLPDQAESYVGRVVGDMAQEDHHAALRQAGSDGGDSVATGLQSFFVNSPDQAVSFVSRVDSDFRIEDHMLTLQSTGRYLGAQVVSGLHLSYMELEDVARPLIKLVDSHFRGEDNLALIQGIGGDMARGIEASYKAYGYTDLAATMAAHARSQFNKDTIKSEWADLGRLVAMMIHKSFVATVGGQSWAEPIVATVTEQVSNSLVEALE